MTKAEKALAVINTYADGGRLKEALEAHEMRGHDLYDAVRTVPAIAAAYARAREIRAEILVDEALTIVDTEQNPNRAKVQADMRKWAASKLNAHLYGDRIDLNVTERVDVGLALTEAKTRLLRPVRDSDQIEDAQYVELPALSVNEPTDKQSVDAPAALPFVNPFDD